jgi:two-component system alkaline phosphatase synthesis response regulator PhoP
MIYLVEDDDNIRQLVIYTLQNTGFEAKGFSNGRDFWQAAAEAMPSLVLLDIMLPGEDGITILRRLRASKTTADIPVMMITAKGTEYDKVLGLETGADDYLSKPFGMMEMTARVKSLLRRAKSTPGRDEYSAGGLSVSISRHSVTVNGSDVALTLKEFDLLTYLMKNSGVVLSRDRILQAVWNFDFGGETRTVDTHILTLRNKLGPCGKLIQTVRGVGYKMKVSE